MWGHMCVCVCDYVCVCLCHIYIYIHNIWSPQIPRFAGNEALAQLPRGKVPHMKAYHHVQQ